MPPQLDERQPALSIIIPAYNEENRLPKSLERILDWRQSVHLQVEILIVENGSTDRTTEIAGRYATEYADVHVCHSAKGKGAAVHAGVMRSRGSNLFICDSDLSMPINEVEKFFSEGLSDYDVLIASRETPGSVRFNEPYSRHMIGRVFNLLVRILAVPEFQDTQCGFKLFRREAALDIFSCQTITGWTFDVEVLFVALRRGYRVTEVPIQWYFDPDSRVKPLQDAWLMLLDILRIRLNAVKGKYGRRNEAVVAKQEVSYQKFTH